MLASTMLPTPLIPLPPEPAVPSPPGTASKSSSQEDLFATLFSPPTPRASPTPAAAQSSYTSRPYAHSRSQSTSSDFGAFVSVSASDDPLHTGGSKDSFTPIDGLQGDFFDRFAEEARAANERSKHQVLDELLKAEKDPFYAFASSDTGESIASTSQHPTPVPSPLPVAQLTPQPVSLLDLPPDAPIPITPASPSPSTSPDPATDERETRHLHRQGNRSELDLSPASLARPPAPVRSPSMPPPTPSRPAPPETQRAQGQSFFSPPALGPARWVSSFLSNTVRSGRTRSTDEGRPTATSAFAPSTSLPHNDHAPAVHAPEHASTLPIGIPSHLFSAAADTVSASLDTAITHGTPFAAAPFVPASGAPGFDGDRRWDKGFSDDFEKTRGEKKSVRLVGRKEMTTPVLSVELADMVRPPLPSPAPKTTNVGVRRSCGRTSPRWRASRGRGRCCTAWTSTGSR